MSDDFEVKGADQFKQLSRALNEAADVELRKALSQGVRRAVKEHVPVAAEALAAALPIRLRPRGEKVSQSISINASHDPGVTVSIKYGSNKRGLGAVNAKMVNQSGQIRHRVFGSNRWVTQHVGGEGWFDKTWNASAPHVRAEIERVIQNVEDEVVRKAKR